MIFQHAYNGHSTVDNRRPGETALSFAPDLRRRPTHFTGELGEALAFREAIGALHDVVVSDLRFKPKDREAYKAWVNEQVLVDLAAVASQRKEVGARLEVLREEIQTLRAASAKRRAPFDRAKRSYFDMLYQRDKDAWFVLDPVVTVHPDELFFECFSQDESSYGRLAVSYEVFRKVGEFACGTTNIDYSAALYDEFQKIRGYKATRFAVDPAGFDVHTTDSPAYREVKIDLPESWVRGFLQVNAAMGRPAATFTLHPMDVHNLCFVMRRHREQGGPRSMRYRLTPGQPVVVVFDPWGTEVVCPRSIYEGPEAVEIRTWGRRRLHILERLIPVAKGFTVHLLGHGMPSFYIADLGLMSFTLGLSGWTANDWAAAANFDLLAARDTTDLATQQRVYETLAATWFATADDLAARAGLDRATTLSALGVLAQAGRVMYDMAKGVYRLRELSQDPLPLETLRFANPREERAHALVENQQVAILELRHPGQGVVTVEGQINDDDGDGYLPTLRLDADGAIQDAQCDCKWHRKNKLLQGPCDHILALRMAHQREVALVSGSVALTN